uniref:Uncharacterized protein n=1 Tax=Clytia hemisphaerica TaxID=252671 RepID=A0A7M5XKH9_9CNID
MMMKNLMKMNLFWLAIICLALPLYAYKVDEEDESLKELQPMNNEDTEMDNINNDEFEIDDDDETDKHITQNDAIPLHRRRRRHHGRRRFSGWFVCNRKCKCYNDCITNKRFFIKHLCKRILGSCPCKYLKN